MKERGTIFSAPEIRAILRDENPKAQMRRVVEPQPAGRDLLDYLDGAWLRLDFNGLLLPRICDLPMHCLSGRPGDRLWVLETWAVIWTEYEPDRSEGQTIRDVPHVVQYRADSNARYPGDWPDDGGDDPACPRWRPSTQMPRWASRIILEIAEVRVQRLQDITEEDARAEGVERGWYERDTPDGPEVVRTDYRAGFRALWDRVSGKAYPWESDPWVWAITFRRLEEENR